MRFSLGARSEGDRKSIRVVRVKGQGSRVKGQGLRVKGQGLGFGLRLGVRVKVKGQG